MKNLLKKLTLTTALILGMFMPLGYATTHALSPAQDACDGITAAGGQCNASSGTDGFNKIIALVINVLSMIVGAVAVIMLIIGGFRYIMSNGDSNGTAAAKNTIMYAIIGLVIVLFAQLIVAFVFDKASDASSGGSGGGGNNNSGANQQQNSNTNGSGTSGNQPNPTTPNDGGSSAGVGD